MFDIGWSELLVIAVVALIVVGPKDLPGMFHTIGRFTAKLRSMARDFSRAMEDAAKESGVNEVAKDLKTMTSSKSLGLDKVQQAAAKFESWDPMKKSAPTVKEPKAAEPRELSPERAALKAKIEAHSAQRAQEQAVETDEASGAPAPPDVDVAGEPSIPVGSALAPTAAASSAAAAIGAATVPQAQEAKPAATRRPKRRPPSEEDVTGDDPTPAPLNKTAP